MLFNSYDFLLGFLPVALAGHHLVHRRMGARAAWVWLVLASLFFYAWWFPPYLVLLLGSMFGNYAFGRVVGSTRTAEERRPWLTAGVAANLALLGWFKYAGFLDRNVEALIGLDLAIPAIALPLAISFFTFQQIAYLVDTFHGRAKAYDFVDYALFVTFFPQLISGPIVHHAEMIPQFREGRSPTSTDRAVGMTMFAIGLAKKVIIADTMGIYADRVFGNVGAGHTPTILGAWTGSTAFFFQVYFDFSGYTDMAVGLARMFGIKLPINFDAPYRANDFMELWQRWHVTLSRFLRDYLYIPLGGNRKGTARRYANLMATMVLGGLWHGAAWTFVFWGFMHGSFLLLNHAWRAWWGGPVRTRWARLGGRIAINLGFLSAAVFFRADHFVDAVVMHGAMLGIAHSGVGTMSGSVPWMFLGVFAIVQLAPTSQRWMEGFEPVLQKGLDRLAWPERFMWKPTVGWGVVIGVLAFLCVPLLERAEAFIYFQF